MTVIGRALPLLRRMMSTSAAPVPRKVTVLGAAGGIGNPLSLLLRMNPLVTDLALYDVTGMPGVVADLSHICTRTKVSSYLGPYELPDALRGSHVVLVLAGVPYRSSMGDEDRFCMNAGIVRGLCESIAKHSPEAAIGVITNPLNATVPIAAEAVIGVITNPLNATVPIAAEAMAEAGRYEARRLLGITSLHGVRARALLAEATGLNATELSVPVVGGNRDNTIVPLFSQATPAVSLREDERARLVRRVRASGMQVITAKDGKGSAIMAPAFAAASFTNSLLKALNGEAVTEYAYVASSVTDAPFFASKHFSPLLAPFLLSFSVYPCIAWQESL
ncbi:unnamed protein product [Closterium sp. NIES-64]|nr:unnamed protein product [Closterium sp. NIES-64]